jgi:hypothetical protein
MYCCNGFQNLVASAGKRGLSALAVEVTHGTIAFLLQSRGLASGDETLWKPVSIDLKINVCSETGIRFCPFCGRKLEELSNLASEAFAEIAREHRSYLPTGHMP